MKNYSILITEDAEADLQGIYDYIAFELLSPTTADAQLSRIEKAINECGLFPEKFRRYEVEPWYSRNLRYFHVDNYCIFYIPNHAEMAITIVRVIYGARNIANLL